jgi:soluble lytic murein transglycosylase
MLAVAKTYSLNKKARKALDILEELMIDPRVAPMMPEILFYMAHSFSQEGKKQAAADLYTEIIADYPKSSSAATSLFERAKYRRSTGMTGEALDDYAQVTENFPKSPLAPQALQERAKLFEKLGSLDEYDEYEKLLQSYSKYSLTYTSVMHWGVKLYQAGEYSDARRVFEKLAAADIGYDANADAAFWIAKCTMAGGNRNLAKIQLAGVIKRFDESHQGFRARSILKTLAEGDAIYSQEDESKWGKFLAVERKPFAAYENDSAEESFPSLEKELSHLDQQALDRLGFLILNHLPEAKWELDRVSQSVSGSNARYALAWALFHSQAYNSAIKTATSLRGRFKEESRSERVWYLLYPTAYPDLVEASTSKYGVDPMLSLAVIREESHFDEESISVSDARGLMQIIPRTGEWLAEKVYGPANFDIAMLFRPAVSIELGSYYLDYLFDKFDKNIVLTLAAYNWGEGNLKRWLEKSPPGDLDVFIESIPPDETRRYVKKVLRSYAVYHSLYPPDHLKSTGSKEDVNPTD